MKTLPIDFKAWVGDKLYTSINASIVEYIVNAIDYKLVVDICNIRSNIETTYELIDPLDINGICFKISDSDIGVKYFTDKKELFKHLVSQI